MVLQARGARIFLLSPTGFFIYLPLLFSLAGCAKGTEKAGPPPPVVEVVEAIRQDVPVYSEWIASTDGLVNAIIRAQVQGYLIVRTYNEGDFVRKGQTLFEIDPRPFQAALDQAAAAWSQAKAARSRALAAVEQAKADLARLEAVHSTTKSNLKRIKPLAEQNAVSRKDLDDADGAEQSADAAVQAGRAAIVGAQAGADAADASVLAAGAAMEKVNLDLSFTRILSPIDGIAGIAKAQVGNLVGPGSIEELTTVSTVDPIRVYIPLSEQEYIRDVQNGGRRPRQNVELFLADGSLHPHRGVFAFTDRQVDIRTGTIKVAVLFPNPGRILRPGQYARVRATGKIKKGALLVPQRAVTELQGSYQLAVVGPDNKVEIRRVQAAERIESLWVIDEGLNPGEKVIAEGVQRARQGMVVNPRPFASEPAPAPVKETGRR